MWEEWERRRSYPDLVFIDGRFRVACAISVALLASSRPLAAAPTVMIHDVSDERPHYDAALAFFDVRQSAETLRVMTPRAATNPERLCAALLQSILDVG